MRGMARRSHRKRFSAQEAPCRPVSGELEREIYILALMTRVDNQRGHPQGEDAVLPNGLAFGWYPADRKKKHPVSIIPAKCRYSAAGQYDGHRVGHYAANG